MGTIKPLPYMGAASQDGNLTSHILGIILFLSSLLTVPNDLPRFHNLKPLLCFRASIGGTSKRRTRTGLPSFSFDMLPGYIKDFLAFGRLGHLRRLYTPFLKSSLPPCYTYDHDDKGSQSLLSLIFTFVMAIIMYVNSPPPKVHLAGRRMKMKFLTFIVPS